MGYGFADQSLRFEQKQRHSKEDALSNHEFELLYEGAQRLPRRILLLQCMFVIMAVGRLGLRRGEITNLEEESIDWDEKTISIPRHEPCDCGQCRQNAEQKVDLTLVD